MDELIGAPIVDIRALKNAQHAIRYVAKYISKAPARFGASKRYWCSRNWELPSNYTETKRDKDPNPWQMVREFVHFIVRDWPHEGFAVRQDGEGGYIGIRTGHILGASP